MTQSFDQDADVATRDEVEALDSRQHLKIVQTDEVSVEFVAAKVILAHHCDQVDEQAQVILL